MASKHLLEGLIKWSMRDPWCDFGSRTSLNPPDVHLSTKGLDAAEIVATIGESLFTVHGMRH